MTRRIETAQRARRVHVCRVHVYKGRSARREPAPLDLRTPSGRRTLPY
jgi:hypothetical protein